MGNHGGDVFHDPRAPLQDRDELCVTDTHGIAQWNSNHLLADSTGLGWHDAYTSLADETPWTATLPALPHYSIAYCLRGSAKIDRRVDGSRREFADLRPRQFGMIPADRASTWDLVGDPEIQLVYLRRQTVDELAITEFDTDPASVHIEPELGFDDPLMEQLVTALLATAIGDRVLPSSGLWADHLIRLIGLQLLRDHSTLGRRTLRSTPTDPSPRSIDAARAYIDAHLGDDLSLSGIAAAVGIRPQRLSNSFRRCTGTTLHQYVIRRRVERAQARLRSTDDPIAIIAADCGFANQSHLTTAFRRHVGTTPGAYRSHS